MIYLTELKTGVQMIFGMPMRIEPRSRGAALFYEGQRKPVRVAESVKKIVKIIRRGGV